MDVVGCTILAHNRRQLEREGGLLDVELSEQVYDLRMVLRVLLSRDREKCFGLI